MALLDCLKILFDCCVNLVHPSFAKDQLSVLQRAATAGLKGVLLCGADVESSHETVRIALELSDQVALDIYTTAGVHPHQASSWQADTKQVIVDMVRQHKGTIRAIGEMGLDYERNYSPPQAQRQAFEAQLDLAVEEQLPVFLHQRQSHDDFIAMLSSYRDNLPAMLVHCFTDSADQLKAYLDLGCYIGITGWLCDERRGTHLKPLIGMIPSDRLIVETDAPYLLPRTMPRPKNNLNEPAYLVHIIKEVAQHHPSNEEELRFLTDINARRFLNV